MALVNLGIAWVAILALFADDWLRIAALAWNSSTYNHIVLIPLILVWLVAQRAPQMARMVPQAWWPGLLLAGGAAFVWLLGAFSGLDVARQLGVVALLIAAVPLLLGVRVSAALAFPLGYALLMVPAGDEIVPLLQIVTARITIFLVQASGIPAVIDGVFIDTPAGLFEVAEACSGVKFLVAMLALGLLVANVCFLSWRRRAAFLLACAVVPVLANGVRAFATIWVAQIVGVEKASGFDHIVYGWTFFALVVALTLAVGWRFFDRPASAAMIDADRINASPLLARLSGWRLSPIVALAYLVLLAGTAQAWARAADALSAPLPANIILPSVPGWQLVAPAPGMNWRPRATGADRRLLASYRDAHGRGVDVFVALYAAQGEGREAGGFGEGALTPQGFWSWHSHAPAIMGAQGEMLYGNSGQFRLAQPGLTNLFCAGVIRNATSGLITGFRVSPVNVSSFRTSGADFTVNYLLQSVADIGSFAFRLSGGFLDTLRVVATKGAPETDRRMDKFAPKLSGNFDLTWSRGAVQANYGARYTGKARRFTVQEMAANPDIAGPDYLYFSDAWQHDVQVAVKARDGRVTFYGGVNNLFDRQPALGEVLYPVSARGRFLYLGMRASLGAR